MNEFQDFRESESEGQSECQREGESESSSEKQSESSMRRVRARKPRLQIFQCQDTAGPQHRCLYDKCPSN